jgi:radical SAM protein with 4Fe4S-binding SPASM domain
MEINGVYWSGGGEPTTIKGFPAYIEEISNSKTEQALITNGILVHDQWISLLKRFNYVAVSFQASRNDTYKKITGYNYREKLYSNIRRLRDILEETILGARCVINRHNYKEVDQIYKDAKDLGFDYLIFIPAVDYEGRGDVELNIEEQNYLIEMVKDFVPALDDSFTNLKQIMNQGVSHYKKGEKGGFPCYTNYIRGTGFINYDGGVWLCQPHIGNPEYCIGNINRHRFIEIWNSERHCEVVELLDEEHKRGNCRNCRSIAYNNVLHNYMLTGNGTAFYDPFL